MLYVGVVGRSQWLDAHNRIKHAKTVMTKMLRWQFHAAFTQWRTATLMGGNQADMVNAVNFMATRHLELGWRAWRDHFLSIERDRLAIAQVRGACLAPGSLRLSASCLRRRARAPYLSAVNK